MCKEVPQVDTGAQHAIIEQERGARGSVGADNALVAVDREQHACGARFRRRRRDDPLAAELFAEKSLLYGARRRHRKGAGQGMRSFRPLRIDRRDIQNRDQFAVDVENRRARTTEIYVSRSIMLASVDRYRPLFGNAGTDAIGPLERLGPHAAEPGSPVSKSARIALVAAVLDGNARRVTE